MMALLALEFPRYADILLFGCSPNAYECALPCWGLSERRPPAYNRRTVLSCWLATSPCPDIHWTGFHTRHGGRSRYG